MSREIMQQALDALKHHRQQTTFQFCETNAAIQALKQELAKTEQEPVAWIANADFVKGQFVEGRVRRVWWECNTGVGQPLYTVAPRKEWVGLTDDEVEDAWGNTPMMINARSDATRKVYARAIESKLKEKNI
jgi:hypothetical protein